MAKDKINKLHKTLDPCPICTKGSQPGKSYNYVYNEWVDCWKCKGSGVVKKGT